MSLWTGCLRMTRLGARRHLRPPRAHVLSSRFYIPFLSRAGMLLRRPADRLPRRVAARHELRVEPEIAQLDSGLAADVKSIGAINDHRVRLRQLADPFLHALRIAPRGALRNLRCPVNRRPRTGIDDLDR